MKDILNYLFEYKSLTEEQAYRVLLQISKGDCNASEMAAFMTIFLMRSITVEELSGFRKALLELCIKINFEQDTLDIVGTGGDGKNTFNISTASCFVAAGAGAKITKQGNKGVTSISGSSNVMQYLGYQFKNEEDQLKKELDQAGICFLHAPLFHPALKNVAPIRKQLGVRTFFNVMGPLVNPARPKTQLLGVYNLEVARIYNYLLQNTTQNFTIVHSLDGYDEISLTADTRLIDREGAHNYTPEVLGGITVQPKDLFGGKTVEQAGELLVQILKGEGTAAQTAVVTANAAAALKNTGKYKTYEDSFAAAKTSITSGRAYQTLTRLIDLQ